MKDLAYLEKYRIFKSKGDDTRALYFELTGIKPYKIFINGKAFNVLASKDHDPVTGITWEHVSVSPRNMKRCPTWEEMCYVKDLFFEDEEECVEYHPKKSEYANMHPYCLHIWRPSTGIITPPKTHEKVHEDD